jgi:hypothetical protein
VTTPLAVARRRSRVPERFETPASLARQAPQRYPAYSLTYEAFKTSRAGEGVYARLRPLRVYFEGETQSSASRHGLLKLVAHTLGLRFVDHTDPATADVIVLGSRGFNARKRTEALLKSHPHALRVFWTRENADRRP